MGSFWEKKEEKRLRPFCAERHNTGPPESGQRNTPPKAILSKQTKSPCAAEDRQGRGYKEKLWI